MKARLRLEDDAILIELRENGRDLALAERIVKGVVDRLREDVLLGGLVTIHFDVDLQTAGLLVAGHVG